MKNCIAIIPARGGSKGIHNKNIRLFDGKPLIYYQIKAALESKYINKVYVSTDSEYIQNIVSSYNDVEVILRPSSISGDRSKSEEVLIHAIDYLNDETINLVVFLQATSPLNRSEYIDACIEKIDEGYDSVCCATEDYGFFLDDKELLDRPMRQQREPRIRECGNCWVVKKDFLIQAKNRLCGKVGYVLISKWDTLEIDDHEDMEIIRPIIERRNREVNDSYFTKRVIESNVSFEENYWAETIDPDGNRRNKYNEKVQYLQDAKDLIDYINAQSSGKVLDVGCGFGYLLSGIDNTFSKYGVEISEYASQIAQKYGMIFTGDLLEAAYEDEYFDIALLYNVIEHLQNPIRFVKEINRVLKIGGKLLISTPDFDSVLARRYKEKFRLLHDSTHISLFSTQSLINLLKDNGFEIEKIDYPFFDSRFFTEENLLKLFDDESISPPFVGNVVYVYAYKC